ncbi:MAG: efflux RND transporter periplasmic adaptor subunit [Sediminibacterium sp. Gen4]|jgi:membrane fusion protein, heavy metal efflux system|uniref:efflux RND transporter periplasmic adaptor subunit n=1 Tax=unclassified Sediminibacterium TaxID=2635961 RepID=UPI0015BB6AD1|nr:MULTISPECIES: efflux RND transporter periplasmic adaptor subunit [unclassified Sediminibacterium]MBW0161949.1 efflux RND transporter periplasmic adaptor subunit [Sediminibacterium sp.]MBW0165284.1 efflux RND transporter periplasmic adaptor subunit [Sediminibacterium sp.]NWK65074.1 efflux RND transporter periplasmic adaptor subunit [Sediminibacterium sp. Gen4]
MKKYMLSIVMVVLLSCGTKEEAATEVVKEEEHETMVELNAEQLKNADITIGYPAEMNMHSTIKVNGVVDVPPQGMVSVSFPLGGYLKSSHLLPGMGVKKGEVIAILEDQSYVQLQQDYLMAKAKMEFLSTDLSRQKELSEQDAASKKTYQQASSEFKIQQVLIRSLEEKLRIVGIDPEKLSVNTITRTISLRSPINGYVAKVNVNIGKYVNPADVLFELVDPDDIHAALTVFEKDIMQIKKGMRASVTLADKPGKKYEVDVILVTRNVDENRGGLVHCHFENANHELLPGMFLNGSFELDNKKAIAVPESAVVRYQSKPYIFIAKDSTRFEMVEVEIGISDRQMIELKAKENTDWRQQKVVLKNAYSLLGKLKNKMEDD